jgi:hypothetical protein
MSNQVKVSKQFLLDGHKEACQSWKERIEKEVPELFKSNELVKGWWYSVNYGKTMFLFDGEVNEDGDPLGAGFDFNGKWRNEDGIGWPCWAGIEKSTKEEISSALIAEAKRQGFINGAKFKNMESCFIQTIERDNHYFWPEGSEILCGRTKKSEWEILGSESNARIFDKGRWASIIPAKDKNDSLKASVKALEEQLKELKKQIG